MLSRLQRSLRGTAARIALAGLLLTALAAGIAWWRWERTGVVAGDIPLPPRAERLRTPRPAADAEPGGKRCVIVLRVAESAEELGRFYRQAMTARGWTPLDAGEDALRFATLSASGERLRELSIDLRHRPEPGRTTFTLTIDPCLPATAPR